jgi:hypothetical protein
MSTRIGAQHVVVGENMIETQVGDRLGVGPHAASV